MRRPIGVFGGTFDPIHIGHLIVASELHHALDLERVLFVPAARPPHKAGQAIADDDHRIRMLELATGHDSRFAISRIEIERPELTFTADTLAALQAELPDQTLVFLMGEDSLRDLPTWHAPDRIVALAELGIATRPGIDLDLNDIIAVIPHAAGRLHLVDVPDIGVSSSDIRRRVAGDLPITYHVPPAVERYMLDIGLYRAR